MSFITKEQKVFLKEYLPNEYWREVAKKMGLEPTERNFLLIRRVRYGLRRDYETLKAIVEIANVQQEFKREAKEIIDR